MRKRQTPEPPGERRKGCRPPRPGGGRDSPARRTEDGAGTAADPIGVTSLPSTAGERSGRRGEVTRIGVGTGGHRPGPGSGAESQRPPTGRGVVTCLPTTRTNPDRALQRQDPPPGTAQHYRPIRGLASLPYPAGINAANVDTSDGAPGRSSVESREVFVTDLHHFLDLPEDTPGPARRLAEHLGDIVRAATAGDAGTAWDSALTCRRRPGNRRCPGRMIVRRTAPGAPIGWRCGVCDDDGVISNWEDSPFDLRRRQLAVAGAVTEIVISGQVAATLRDLRLLDIDCERQVFRTRAHNDGAVLAATAEELDELIGCVAAEANHEPNRRRQQRLDAAFDALNTAASTIDGW